MQKFSRHIIFSSVGALLLLSPSTALGQKPDTSQQIVPETTEDLSELTLAETLQLPEVPTKARGEVRRLMQQEARGLQKLGYKVETMRQEEVVIATIPADKLFAPNDTVLTREASEALRPFLSYFNTSGRYKVILAMHSDDTGSDQYLYQLTERRIIALYDYFDLYANQTEMLQGYPMADSEPVKDTPNNSMTNRRTNRRLEIYIVPGPTFISAVTKSVK